MRFLSEVHSRLIILILSTFILASCGGGGSAPAEDITPPAEDITPPTEDITPAPEEDDILTGTYSGITGLNYKTATQTGVTDATGTFKYKAGETVSFSIGDIQLTEEIDAKETLSFEADVSNVPTPMTVDSLNKAGFNEEDESFYTLAPGNLNTAASRDFAALSNMLVLVTTFGDIVGDSINISPDVATFFINKDIDVTVKVKNFRSKIQDLAEEAKTSGLIDDANILDWSEALTVAADLGFITTNFKIPAIERTYVGNDASSEVLTASFDDEGYMTSVSLDADNEVLEFAIHVENGNLVQIGNDLITITYTYNAKGDFTSLVAEAEFLQPNYQIGFTSADGNLTRVEDDFGFEDRTYDAGGNVEKITEGQDTAVNQVIEYTYIEGIMSTKSERPDDSSPVTVIYRYQHDGNGNVTVRTTEGADGVVTLTETSTYEAIGVSKYYGVMTEYHYSGLTDYTEKLNYNASGQQLGMVRTGVPGSTTFTEVFTVDSDGYRITERSDEDGAQLERAETEWVSVSLDQLVLAAKATAGIESFILELLELQD